MHYDGGPPVSVHSHRTASSACQLREANLSKTKEGQMVTVLLLLTQL
jgi:hypothetical protein